MAKEKQERRTKSTYSVWRLETARGKDAATNPDTEWACIAYFDGQSDALQAAKLLKTFVDDPDTHFGVVREIREKDSTPKINRTVV